MSSDQFKNLSEALKNVVLALATIIAGTWTYYTYLEPEPAIDLRMSHVLLDHKDSTKKYLQVSVRFEDVGKVPVPILFSRTVLLGQERFPGGGLFIVELVENGDGTFAQSTFPMRIAPKTTYDGLLVDEYKEVPGFNLHPGYPKELKFVAVVNAGHNYQIDFGAYYVYKKREHKIFAQDVVIGSVSSPVVSSGMPNTPSIGSPQ